jgi:hypothetical protein
MLLVPAPTVDVVEVWVNCPVLETENPTIVP